MTTLSTNANCAIMDYSTGNVILVTLPDTDDPKEIEDYLRENYGYDEDECYYMCSPFITIEIH